MHDAIEEGSFFHMQTFKQALIALVVSGEIDRDTAANAATNKHDFLVSLEHAVKDRDATEREAVVAEATADEPDLRVVRPAESA
jgi:Tfp pilus assembly ATPase PilU